MMWSIPRSIGTAVLGALAGAACLVVAVAWNPAITLEMDRDLPGFATGFHPLERNGQESFAWTSGRAEVTLPGLDRRVPWTCAVRFRGARPPDLPQPDLVLAIDGVRAGVWHGTNDFEDVEVTAPATPMKPGLLLTLDSTTTFVPGGSDPRRLGVQVDRLSCRPAAGIVLPPRRALGAVALAAALLGAGFAMAGITAASAIGAAALMAAGQAYAIVSWGGLYGPYVLLVVRLAFWMACAMAGLVLLLEFLRREPFRNTARFAIAFSAGALYLQLLALLHPSKPLVDALFHAHRFDGVLAGRFYFTQLSTSATPFPYAIGLYLFAAPWAFLTADHVALLRVIVSASEIVAGALLYLLVVRAWGNRLVGAVAVALFSLVPVSYGIIGNANLTNAFGQAVSVIAVAALTLWVDRLRRIGPFVGVALLVTLGLICHVSTVVLLTSTLVCIAGLFFFGGALPLRTSARPVLLLTIVALAASAVLYWGHFGELYTAQFERMRAAVGVSQPVGGGASRPAPPAGAAASSALGRTTLSLSGRAGQALEQTAANLGWPILLLAIVGAWRMTVEGARDRLGLVIGAWGLVCLAFVALSVLWPGGKTYQQDAAEFIGRVEHATMPAAVLLAARGAVWAWRAGLPLRLASAILMLGAVATGIFAWAAWLQ
jgi:hypothetical protein